VATESPSTGAKALGAAAAALLAVAILAAGWLLISRTREPERRPQPGEVLLSTQADMDAAGTSLRIRLKEPGTLSFSIDASGGALDAAFGPAAGQVAGQPDRPDPARTVTWAVAPGAPPREETVYAAGNYALRLTPAAKAGGAAADASPRRVRVDVRRVAPR
jgi:hypothetical protein